VEGVNGDTGQLAHQQGQGRLLFDFMVGADDACAGAAKQMLSPYRLPHCIDYLFNVRNVPGMRKQHGELGLDRPELGSHLAP
jgi:hypothetical protein